MLQFPILVMPTVLTFGSDAQAYPLKIEGTGASRLGENRGQMARKTAWLCVGFLGQCSGPVWPSSFQTESCQGSVHLWALMVPFFQQINI